MTSQIALITGGSRGLGRATALHLARQGIDVVLTYRSNAAAADDTVADIGQAGGTAVALQLDTADTSRFDKFADQLADVLRSTWNRDTFDYLVNNAGIGVNSPFAQTTEEDVDALIAVHIKGVYFLTQGLLPLLADGGRIVNVSSGLARFALPGFSAYGMAKGAIEVLTRYLALELGPRGIAVNTVAPGAVETDFAGGFVRDNAEANQRVADTVAMGRAGLPDDIGGAVAALLAGDTQWITGQRIEVSGGQNI